jgi:hypothetical protein
MKQLMKSGGGLWATCSHASPPFDVSSHFLLSKVEESQVWNYPLWHLKRNVKVVVV